MNEIFFEHNKIAAYFLWDYTQHENALNLWRCTEDIAVFLAQHDIIDEKKLRELRYMPWDDLGYKQFVRNIAFRIYIYTGKGDMDANWYAAEHALRNNEWCRSMAIIATIHLQQKKGDDPFSQVYDDF